MARVAARAIAVYGYEFLGAVENADAGCDQARLAQWKCECAQTCAQARAYLGFFGGLHS